MKPSIICALALLSPAGIAQTSNPYHYGMPDARRPKLIDVSPGKPISASLDEVKIPSYQPIEVAVNRPLPIVSHRSLPLLDEAKQFQIGQRSFGRGSGTACGSVVAYAMNEGSGSTFFDSSGNSNNATISSGAVTWQTNSPLPGTTPFFNGTGYALAANHTLTNFDGTTPFTVAARVFTTQSGGETTMIGDLDTTASFKGWELTVGNFGSRYIAAYIINVAGSNAIEVSTTGSISSGLHYVAYTYDGSRNASGVVIYLDGTSVGTFVNENNLSASIATGLNPRLGARADGSDELNNAMTSVEVWPCVLTAPQIAACAAGSGLC